MTGMASRTAPKPGVTTSIVPRELNTYYRNARRGDTAAIAASLKAHDQYKPVVANIGTHTGRPNEVLAGNHTLMAVRDLAEAEPDDKRWQSILVHWVDVDDDRAARIVVADNKTAELGDYDPQALFELVDGLGDLTGTGFTDEDLADLDALVQESDLSGLNTDPFATPGDDNDPPKSKSDDGLIDTKDVDEQRESYADAATRLIILTLPIAQFVWAQEQLAKYRATHDLDSNTEALVLLLEDWTGEDAPRPDAEVSEEAVTAAEEIAQ